MSPNYSFNYICHICRSLNKEANKNIQKSIPFLNHSIHKNVTLIIRFIQSSSRKCSFLLQWLYLIYNSTLSESVQKVKNSFHEWYLTMQDCGLFFLCWCSEELGILFVVLKTLQIHIQISEGLFHHFESSSSENFWQQDPSLNLHF